MIKSTLSYSISGKVMNKICCCTTINAQPYKFFSITTIKADYLPPHYIIKIAAYKLP